MNSRPTKEQVWAMISEPLTSIGTAHLEVIRPFVEASVDVLEDMFEMPAILKNFADARLRYMRYCVDNGFYKVMADAMSTETMSVSEDMVARMFADVIDMVELVVADVDTFLQEEGVTEEEIMIGPEVGLSVKNKYAWQNGTLTIGDILATQPEVILQNNP